MADASTHSQNLRTVHQVDRDETLLYPIDLASKGTKINLPAIDWYNYHVPPTNMEITNTPPTATVKANWSQVRPYINLGPLLSNYVFSQLHFHWGNNDSNGSEHTINNKSLPMEMHVVHFKADYKTQDKALTQKDGLVALVYLFKIQNEDNPSMRQIVQALGEIHEEHSSSPIKPIAIYDLARPFVTDYLMYWGSVKTDSCTHRILWLISREPMGISKNQLFHFWRLNRSLNTSKNLRNHAIQDSTGRTLFHVNIVKSMGEILLRIPASASNVKIKSDRQDTSRSPSSSSKKSNKSPSRTKKKGSQDSTQKGFFNRKRSSTSTTPSTTSAVSGRSNKGRKGRKSSPKDTKTPAHKSPSKKLKRTSRESQTVDLTPNDSDTSQEYVSKPYPTSRVSDSDYSQTPEYTKPFQERRIYPSDSTHSQKREERKKPELPASDSAHSGKIGDQYQKYKWPFKYFKSCSRIQLPAYNVPRQVPGKRFPDLQFGNLANKDGYAIMTNTGKTAEIQFRILKLPYLHGGPLGKHVYIFSHLHFHYNQEDETNKNFTLEGRAYAMEAHAVYFNKSHVTMEEAAHKEYGIAVVACFFEVNNKDNREFRHVTEKLHEIKEPFTRTNLAPGCLSWLSDLGPTGYFTYPGSKSPGQKVSSTIWILYPEPIHISREQINAFRKLKKGETKHTAEAQDFIYRPMFYSI